METPQTAVIFGQPGLERGHKDFFAARFPEYELGFQINEFEGKKDPIMSMSKYDYINDKFLVIQ